MSVPPPNIPYGPTPTPGPSVIIDFAVGHLAADPVRPRVYATVPSANSVLIIDTDYSSVITKTIPDRFVSSRTCGLGRWIKALGGKFGIDELRCRSG